MTEALLTVHEARSAPAAAARKDAGGPQLSDPALPAEDVERLIEVVETAAKTFAADGRHWLQSLERAVACLPLVGGPLAFLFQKRRHGRDFTDLARRTSALLPMAEQLLASVKEALSALEAIKPPRTNPPGHAELLRDLESHYGLSGLSTYEEIVTAVAPTAAWRAATEAESARGGKPAAAASLAPDDKQQQTKASYKAAATGKAVPQAGRGLAGSSFTREAAVGAIAYDLAWKLQAVASEACSSLLELLVAAAERGLDAAAALRAAASSGVGGVPLDGFESSELEVAADSTGSQGVLEQVQVISDGRRLQSQALGLNAMADRLPRLVEELRRKEATGRQNAAAKGAAAKLKQPQRYLPPPAVVLKAEAVDNDLRRSGRALCALMLTSAAWRASPPADLYESVVSALDDRLLKPQGLSDETSIMLQHAYFRIKSPALEPSGCLACWWGWSVVLRKHESNKVSFNGVFTHVWGRWCVCVTS